MTDTTAKRAFSIDEFSDRWGWGRNTTYNLIASGDLKSMKVNKRRVITVEQEEEFRQHMEKKSA
jgi:hypothetical protein